MEEVAAERMAGIRVEPSSDLSSRATAAESLREFLGDFIHPHGNRDHAAGRFCDGRTDFGGGHAVGDGHVQIENHDVGMVRLNQAKGFAIVRGFAEQFDIGRGFQDVADGAPDGVEVIGD